MHYNPTASFKANILAQRGFEHRLKAEKLDLGADVRFDNEWKLSTLFRRASEEGSLHDHRPPPDFLDRYSRLELEGADEREDESFHPDRCAKGVRVCGGC